MSIPDFRTAFLAASCGSREQFLRSPLPQIALSGRSNVGKSTLLNSLAERKSLARVSSVPGKTITVNYYAIKNELMLVDLPGYGYSKRSKQSSRAWSDLTDAYFTKNPCADRIRGVVQLVDSRIGTTDDDDAMIDFLEYMKIPYIICLTKADKLGKTESKEILEDAKKAFPDAFAVVMHSSADGRGRQELRAAIADLIK